MSAGRTERYVISTPDGEYVLHGVFKPEYLAPTERGVQLVRAYGYRQQYNLRDAIADAGVIVLTGQIRSTTEDELALDLREKRRAVRLGTALSRNDRPTIALKPPGIMVSKPVGNDSNVADVTIRLIPAAVPDEDSGIYDW